MNIERPTSNVEWEKMNKQTYDLGERLLEYSVRIIKLVEQLPNTNAGSHVAGQLLRSGTSPYPNFSLRVSKRLKRNRNSR